MAGIFGIGGGAVIVPVVDKALALLDYDDDVRVHVALGTSLAVIVPTSLRSFRAHKARGAVDMEVLRRWVVAAPVGVLVASGVAAVVSGDTLRLAFAGVATLVALRLLFNRPGWRLGAELPTGPGNFAAGDADRVSVDADGRRRRGDEQHLVHPLRPADPPGDRHRGGRGRADRDPRHARLHAGAGSARRGCRRSRSAT